MRTPNLVTADLDALIGALLLDAPDLGVPRIGQQLRARGHKVSKHRLTESVARVKRVLAVPTEVPELHETSFVGDPTVARLIREAEARGRARAEREAARRPARCDLDDRRIRSLLYVLDSEALRKGEVNDWSVRARAIARRLEAFSRERAELVADLRDLYVSLDGYMLRNC